MKNSEARPLVIFDGDDTLWRTMPLYVDAKRRFFALVSTLVPSDEGIEDAFEERDRHNVARWGFTIERFRNSMLETYRERLSRAGKVPQLNHADQISRIATSVLRRRAASMGSAERVLEKLSPSFHLVLLTKGEYELQNRRVADSGLGRFFERVVIVNQKDAPVFRQLLEELKVQAHLAWSVGDSLRSDIRPALAAGLRAIWVPQKTWSYEEDSLPPTSKFKQVRSLRELPRILERSLEEET